MTPELAAADRAAAVRAAARSWRRAGAVDAAALAAIETLFPDDRVRVGPVFRALLFLFTVIAVCGAFGFIAMGILGAHGQEGVLAGLALAVGAALLALTEHQIGVRRRRQGGTEAATSLLGIAFLLSGAAWFLFKPASFGFHDAMPILCLICAALAGAAARRWGYPLYAAAAAAALLVALARLPAGRALWIAVPLAAAPLLRLSESSRLPPAHRSSAMAALLVALAGLYAAVHVGSWDAQLIEALGGRQAAPPASYPQPSPIQPYPAHTGWLWWAAVAATALVPVLLLALGIRRRRLPLLLLGAAAAAVSLATLCVYVHLGPAWLVLIAAGALAIAAALALWRFLDAGAGQERAGFTAAPLLTDPRRQQLLEAGAAILTLSPEARAPGGEPGFAGGGGRAGGGGASGEF